MTEFNSYMPPQSDSKDMVEPVKRRRGRPKGSTNAKRAAERMELYLPDDAIPSSRPAAEYDAPTQPATPPASAPQQET